MNKGKVVLGIMAGVAIGAIAGILLAPEKGSTTRKQIKDKRDDYAGKLKSKFDDFCESLSAVFERTKDDAEELAQKGKEKLDEVKKEVRSAASNIYPSS